jgi:hypothetical protein
MQFSSCILVTLKFAAGRQTCHPSHAELGLKDWATIRLNEELLVCLVLCLFARHPGVDVMITFFCDFTQLSAKKIAFFSKTNVMIQILNILALF